MYTMHNHGTTGGMSPDRFKGIKHMVGNTPMLAIHYVLRGRNRVVFAKAEHMNLTGSIKDRMAFHILQKAYECGRIKPGDTIVEATSGNTGIAFAAIGRALGHPVIIFMPDWMSRERINLIESLGAKIVLVSKEEGGFLGCIRMTEDLAKTEENIFLPCQFSNEANIRAHEESTGPELWWQLQFNNMRPRAFVAGVGTGGTIMGVGSYLRKQDPGITIHPLQPSESPTLSTGRKVGHHRIQGVSDEFIPSIVDLPKLDGIISVHDGDAILMAQKLASTLGIAVGISSGANVLGAMMIQSELDGDAAVATILPDDNKKYLSTDLLRQEPVKAGYLTPEVELVDYHAYKRVCHTCCDYDDCGQKMS
jgi:cysteine synthase A